MSKSFAEVKEIYEPLLKSGNDYYNFGVSTAGPFLYGYISWLCGQTARYSPQKIFFFSRDGYLMQKAYEIVSGNKNSKYICFSRNSLRQALLYESRDFADSLKYFGDERYISVGALLQYYGFNAAERNEICIARGLNIDSEHPLKDLASVKPLQNLYRELSGEILRRSREQNELLADYLAQNGFSGDCASVDIGWHGRMQYYLDEFCALNGICARQHGYYVGVSPVSMLRSPASGYLYGSRNDKMRKKVLCFFGVLEKIFQSLEGSVCGYSRSGGAVVPLTEEYEYADDAVVRRSIADMQNGALDFVRAACGRQMETKHLVSKLLDFGANPTLADVKLFSFMYNVDGVKCYFTAQKSLFKYKLSEFVHALSNSPWKTGFLKSAFKLPLPYFALYSVLRK